MKNKPLRHKESNTFKFQPFSERIANIDVDIFHRVGHFNENEEEEEEDNTTTFYKTLQKCNDLNLSNSYGSLKRNIGGDITTLPQLLAQKDKIISALLQCLDEADPLSLQPCLQLVAALVKDIRREFYPFYSDLLTKIINLLSTKNAEQLEWAFTCLAYLYKYLWRFMIKDVNVVVEQLMPLLSSSRPTYINNFASESFAFVARKVKDKRGFLKLILKSVIKNKDGVSGCGRLLFEVVNGVQGQFHTCAQSWIQSLLDSMLDTGLPQELMVEIVKYMFIHVATTISPKHSKIFWDILQETLLAQVSNLKNGKTDDVLKSTAYLLDLTLTVIKQKNCIFLVNPVEFVKTLITIITDNEWPSEMAAVLVDISTTILLSPRIRLPQDLTVTLIQKVMFILDWNSVKQFTIQTLSYSQFDVLILPNFLKICETQDFNDVVLQLTKVILYKTPPVKCFDELKKKSLCPLYSSSVTWKENFIQQLLTILDLKTKKEIEENQDYIIQSLIVLPSFAIGNPSCALKVENLIIQLMEALVQECSSEENSIKSFLFLVTQAMSCLFLIAENKNNINLPHLHDILLPLIDNSVLALQAIEVYLHIVKKEDYENNMEVLKTKLIQNLSSPFHKVRYLSASILLYLEQDRKDSEAYKMLSIIVESETISASVHEYRDKLRQLQLLECTDNSERQAYFNIPLNYLLGNLYVNFKLLWEPVSKLIVSYAKMLSTSQFWPVFVNQLNLAVEQVEKGVFTGDTYVYKCKILSEACKNVSSVEERTDVVNHRILLWQVMTNIPEVCEEKNRDIVVLFLNFLKSEYYRISPDEASSWNIKQGNRKENCEKENEKIEEKMETDDAHLNTDEQEESDDEEMSTDTIKPVQTASKSLLAHLSVFGKMRNPRSMFKEAELSKAYLDFLSHKNPAIQKAALDCIMTYKFKYLLPYKDHLYGLIDDKTFKEEVTLFRIDTDNDVIRPEHRSELIPVVMRIVYSKMLNRSGIRTGSKSAKQARRSIVFRFLAGCQQEELLFYLRMAFRLFTQTVQDDVAVMVSSIQQKLDLTSMIPPKRLLSTTNLLSVVLSQCGSLLSHDALRFLLKVLLCVGSTISAVFDQRELVHAGYLNILKNIRNLSHYVLTKFFQSFETFPWLSEELDSAFEVFVWPYLKKLPMEGIHSPTSLLKLFMAWSQIPRYHPLLIKFQNNSPESTPLPFVMSLLVSPKVHGSVVNAIMDMVDNLLSCVDSDNEENSSKMSSLLINNVLPVESYQIKGDLSFGSRILYPHISAILEKMKWKLKKPKSSLGHRDLNILSHITSLVHDSETSETILTLTLPMVGRKAGAGEHIICPLITTVTNLIKNVSEPYCYIRSIAPLFGSVAGAEPRRMLSALVKSIDREEDGLNAKLLEDLNAWNAKWLDQPDFERRLDAFKEIQQLNDKGQISVLQGAIIIYTCFHFIRVEKDLSLRDSASQCLRKLCPSLSKQYPAEKEFLINKTILGIISTGIRDKKHENVQQESITLLGYMARECPDMHPVLRDLSLLGNKADLEVDFFENLQHLQLHRKVRALLKFCEVSKGLVKLPSTRTLTQFVLPIVSQFLCSEKYLNKNTIVDAAIEVLGTVCKMLPWHQYELVFRYYLGKLSHSIEYQKQLVRIVIAILNAFHFDLRNADLKEAERTAEKEIMISCEENVGEEKEESLVKDGETAEDIADNNSSDDVQKEVNELDDILEQNESMIVEQNENVEQLEVEVTSEPVLEKQNLLSKSLSTRVIYTIRTILLPKIHRIITARTQSDAMHKVNRKMAGPDRDEEDILRIPIAIAAIKLLQKLPEEILQQNVSGILMKMCTFLKSRLDSVRRTTRETLQKIIVALGPKYLLQLIQEMSAILTHGFHVHVLVYSIHSVLVVIKSALQAGDIDPCIPLILQACRSDLFGKTSEEKEVKQIAGNLMEARANRSYDMYHILAEFASQKSLINLIIPLKEELSSTYSHKAVNKARECLRHIVLGMIDNKFLTTESLLIFAYGTASESIPALFSNLKKKQTNEKSKSVLLEPQVDTFLIPKEPKARLSVQSKLCAQTNAHIFVEFGLTLYHFLLKRDRIKGADYRPHLDPLVKVLSECLKSEHVKITTLSLQCLCWVLKFDLPSLQCNIQEITENIFKLLHKYAVAGLSKGDNFDLVMAAFKVVAVLVRDVKYYNLTKQQQRTLLLYCEQDIHDYSRQTVAFSLLKAILVRKLQLPELNSVMEKVAKISITADIEHVRLQARQIFHLYLMEYALGKKLEKHLTWYLQQLEYDLQPGRESALEMIRNLINTLPNDILKEQSGFIFVTVAARIINDEIPACRKMAAGILNELLEKVNNNTRESLFDIVILWLQDKKALHRRLAVQLCGILAAQDKINFEQRLGTIFSHIIVYLRSELKELKPQVQEAQVNSNEQLRDHHLYQLLHLLVKVSTLYPSVLTDTNHVESMQFFAESAQTLLAYPHEWVRLAASQFIGRVLSVLKPAEVAELANKPDEQGKGYLLHDTRHTLRSLTLDLCSQLSPGVELNDKLLMQTMKNLIFLAEVLQYVKTENGDSSLSIQWLIRKIKKIIHMEIVQAPRSVVLRTICYNWMAALVAKLDSSSLQPLLPLIMAPIVRELNLLDEDKTPLKEVAKETANFVKKKIGSEGYNKLLNSLTTKQQVQRSERKKERAQMTVRDPEKAAKRKISKQLKKKIQKKRKIEGAKRGKLPIKSVKKSFEFEAS